MVLGDRHSMFLYLLGGKTLVKLQFSVQLVFGIVTFMLSSSYAYS